MRGIEVSPELIEILADAGRRQTRQHPEARNYHPIRLRTSDCIKCGSRKKVSLFTIHAW